MLDNMLRDSFREFRSSLGMVIRAGLFGAIGGLILAELAGLVLDGNWPTRIYVHFVAVVFAVIFGYAVSLTTGAIVVVRGLRSATQQLERATRSAMGGGFRTVESVIDANKTHQPTP